MNKIVYVQGAKWFDKTYGNTYNNAKVIDGMEMEYLGYSYGYGSDYYYRARDYFDKKYGKDNYILVDLGAVYMKQKDVKSCNF